jgi:hypothetical protein
MDSASIVDLAAANDQVFLTGVFTNPGLRLQNCSFDAATVLEGPPANTLPVTLFECAVIGGVPVAANGDAKTEFIISGSTSTDVAVGAVGATTSMALFTAAYNGSGALSWLSYAAEGAIRPRAMASLRPSFGNAALRGPWGGGVDDPSVPGQNQVPLHPPLQNPPHTPHPTPHTAHTPPLRAGAEPGSQPGPAAFPASTTRYTDRQTRLSACLSSCF